MDAEQVDGIFIERRDGITTNWSILHGLEIGAIITHRIAPYSFPVWEKPGPGTKVEKQSSAGRGIDVCTFHQNRLAELQGQGKTPDPLLDFNRYILMSNQEEDAVG